MRGKVNRATRQHAPLRRICRTHLDLYSEHPPLPLPLPRQIIHQQPNPRPLIDPSSLGLDSPVCPLLLALPLQFLEELPLEPDWFLARHELLRQQGEHDLVPEERRWVLGRVYLIWVGGEMRGDGRWSRRLAYAEDLVREGGVGWAEVAEDKVGAAWGGEMRKRRQERRVSE